MNISTTTIAAAAALMISVACKGHGACKGASNACKGQNGCKGQGFTEATAEECAKIKGAKFEPAK